MARRGSAKIRPPWYWDRLNPEPAASPWFADPALKWTSGPIQFKRTLAARLRKVPRSLRSRLRYYHPTVTGATGRPTERVKPDREKFPVRPGKRRSPAVRPTGPHSVTLGRFVASGDAAPLETKTRFAIHDERLDPYPLRLAAARIQRRARPCLDWALCRSRDRTTGSIARRPPFLGHAACRHALGGARARWRAPSWAKRC